MPRGRSGRPCGRVRGGGGVSRGCSRGVKKGADGRRAPWSRSAAPPGFSARCRRRRRLARRTSVVAGRGRAACRRRRAAGRRLKVPEDRRLRRKPMRGVALASTRRSARRPASGRRSASVRHRSRSEAKAPLGSSPPRSRRARGSSPPAPRARGARPRAIPSSPAPRPRGPRRRPRGASGGAPSRGRGRGATAHTPSRGRDLSRQVRPAADPAGHLADAPELRLAVVVREEDRCFAIKASTSPAAPGHARERPSPRLRAGRRSALAVTRTRGPATAASRRRPPCLRRPPRRRPGRPPTYQDTGLFFAFLGENRARQSTSSDAASHVFSTVRNLARSVSTFFVPLRKRSTSSSYSMGRKFLPAASEPTSAVGLRQERSSFCRSPTWEALALASSSTPPSVKRGALLAFTRWRARRGGA